MPAQWRQRLKFNGLVATAFALGLMIAAVFRLPTQTHAQQELAAGARAGTASAATIRTLDDLSNAFASVTDAIKPSVVYIKSEQRTRADRIQLPPGFDQFFQFPGFPNQPEQRQIEESAGSGFLVSPDGYILTNNHVVDGASKVTVRLLDRREFTAKVVGTDPNTDLAVLKIDAPHLSPAPLGDSDKARIGQWVLAVGNPLGEELTFTVTSGIISAKGRSLALPGQTARSIQDFIQTDAAINPGNSGGPLVSVDGEVIGVNSAIASETGYYTGYGFAIPINLARRVMDQLIAHGRVQRVALGITARDAGPNDAAYVGLPSIQGVRVEDLGADSPAKKAGIEAGDVIVAVDGHPVSYVGQLQQEIAFRQPGNVVKVEVARKGGVRKTYDVRLEAIGQPEEAAASETESPETTEHPGTASLAPLGIRVVPLTAGLAREYQIDAGIKGLLVTDVNPEGPAWERLAPPSSGGPDVILSVENSPVHTVAEFRKILDQQGKSAIVTLRVYNGRLQSKRIERVQLSDRAN